MSRGGGDGSSSCTTCTSVSLGKLVRRAFRGGGGGGRKQRVKDRRRMQQRPVVVDGGVSSSVELISSGGGGSGSASASWSSASVEARRDSVVRVKLSGGVVEVYAGVVLARTVIRRHPPGLCLAHPDVFRNPHGAVVRPLEPLFPGQEFFLLPETTIQKLQRNIPECSVGAFSDDDDEPASSSFTDTTTAMSWSSSETESGSESEEERDAAAPPAPPDGYCCARDYFVDKDRWAEWNFKRMVALGLAAEGRRSATAAKPIKRKRRRSKKRNDALLPTAPPSGSGSVSGRPKVEPKSKSRPTRTTWEPSLPSVEEEGEEEEEEEEDCRPDDHLLEITPLEDVTGRPTDRS